MIKLIKEGEGLETGDESDDSDYEMESEQAIGSAPEKRVDEMEETEPESLPVFTVGSYARHAQHTSGVSLELITLSAAGNPYFSICTRT